MIFVLEGTRDDVGQELTRIINKYGTCSHISHSITTDSSNHITYSVIIVV